MAWTDEMVDQLRAMWAEGLTTGEIGKRLGVSKNSIVGKVHRLGLSGRPSPIKKKEENETIAASVETPTKPAKEKNVAKEPKVTKPKAEKAVVTTENPTEKNIVKTECQPKIHNHGGKTMLTDLDNHTCRWPLGDPKDENFHFCGRKVRIGQTYCDEHANIAYVKANKK